MPQRASSEALAFRSTYPPPRHADAVEPFETVRRDTHPIAIRELHPARMTVGYREVAERRRLRRAAAAAGDGASPNLIVPVVFGPGGRSYILDRHHELCVRAAEGVADVQVAVVDDLRRLEWVGFWRTLDRRGWCRPQDAEGQRQDYSYIPITIEGLADDPFRSLARALRRAGGYVRKKAPFSDFLWVDFLRGCVPCTLVNDDFEAALREALELVRNGGPVASVGLQSPKIELRPKTPGLPTNSSAIGLLDAVSSEAARQGTSAENGGAAT